LPTRAADLPADLPANLNWSKEQTAYYQHAVAVWKQDTASATVMIGEDLLLNTNPVCSEAQRRWLQENVLKGAIPVALAKLTADFDSAVKLFDYRNAYIASTVARKLNPNWIDKDREYSLRSLQNNAIDGRVRSAVWRLSDVRGYITRKYNVKLRENNLVYEFKSRDGQSVLVVRFTATNISTESDPRYAPCIANVYSRRLVDYLNQNVDFTKPQRLLHPGLCFVIYDQVELSPCMYMTGHDGVLNREELAWKPNPDHIEQIYPGVWKTNQGPNNSVRVRAIFSVPESTRVACLMLPGALPVALPISNNGFPDFEEED